MAVKFDSPIKYTFDRRKQLFGNLIIMNFSRWWMKCAKEKYHFFSNDTTFYSPYSFHGILFGYYSFDDSCTGAYWENTYLKKISPAHKCTAAFFNNKNNKRKFFYSPLYTVFWCIYALFTNLKRRGKKGNKTNQWYSNIRNRNTD